MEIISTDLAPKAIGPYSQAVKSGNFVFVSGQIPLTSDGVLVEGGIELQIKQVMENLKAVLLASGSSLEKVVKTTIFLVDLNDFKTVNEIYGSYFSGDKKPARATVQVVALPRGVRIEIECVAEI